MENNMTETTLQNASEIDDNATLPNEIDGFIDDVLSEFYPDTQGEPESEVNDVELSNDDEDIDVDNVEDEEQVSEELPENVVEYDQLKDHTFKFKVGGVEREMTIDHIVSELGQVEAANKSQREITNERQTYQREFAKLQDQQESFQLEQQNATYLKEMKDIENQMNQYQTALQQARANNDFQSVVQFQEVLQNMSQRHNMLNSEVENTTQTQQKLKQSSMDRQIREQVNLVNTMGYGDLISNETRQEAWVDYSGSNLSPSAQELANLDATLMIAVEKARLYDKAKSRSSKRVKNSNKSLKAPSSKTPAFTKKEESGDPALDIVNKLFGDGPINI